MTITGLEVATEMAIERANRSKDTICIVQVDRNEYVLWRQSNLVNVSSSFPHYRVVKTIRINNNDIR